ncbi:unnamed protein product [Adineta steineri]|uniref:Guanine nucleotide-binding protein G(q) subunit alpha n=1 Tax=Adineta steineri TaxID=433720 RepID=A0A814FVT6_9BILA|nr:unnamed protein product [Adineta steineri]CAF1190369.1 unnamed protein product [Adineta steineri]
MSHESLIPCCKDYVFDWCLNDDDVINKHINHELQRLRRKDLSERKLLLLGNAEAGKSTFLKQMKLIHGQGFKEEEKHRIIPFIYKQIIIVVRCICRAMENLRINFENTKNEEYARFLNSSNSNIHDFDHISTLSTDTTEAIKHIWSDKGIQVCYSRRREYSLTDSAKYFLDDIDRISQANFIPTDDDFLRVRIPTTDIVQEDFQFPNARLRVIDVGGQRTERRKWIHCFDNVTSIIFLASLIEYDQNIVDEPSAQNLMKESVALFSVILLSDYFYNASIILFLNKTDLLPERLASKPLRYTYPDFIGADNDVEAAKEFIKNKYLELVEPRYRHMEKNIYPHYTCSVDKKNIRIVFESVRDTVLAHNLYYWSLY